MVIIIVFIEGDNSNTFLLPVRNKCSSLLAIVIITVIITMEIKDFESLLSPMLEDKKIVSYKTANLIAPGENYGSTMLSVDVKLEDDEDLHLVAKMCPPTEIIKKLFNIPVTFKKEVGFYNVIVPTLQQFQRERGSSNIMDFFSKYYGSRFSLNPESQEVDDDACLLLENIKVKGYDIGDRITGFSLETAEFIIKDLAMFHAVPIAFKLTHPERFKEEILPYLVRHVQEDTYGEGMIEGLIQQVLTSAEKNEECVQYLEQMKARMELQALYFTNPNSCDNEPFSTIAHCDFWVNNTMLKFDDEGKPISNAMADFQLACYGNFAHDLLFFIYSSLNTDIITEHYQRLIDLYYKTFIEVLEDLQIDTDDFTYGLFLQEIINAAKDFQFFHIMFMMKPIFTDKSKVKELSDLNEDALLETESVHEMYYTKLWHTILDFAAKGFL